MAVMVEAAQTVAQQQAAALAAAQAAQAALAQQQIITAWVSAIAAAIQAVGAVAAIFFSVKLARDAEKREAAAERASVARAEAAERAAAERVAKADREALRREEERHRRAYNEPLEMAISYVPKVLLALDDQIEEAANQDQHTHVIGGFDAPARRRLETVLDNLLGTPGPPEVVDALEILRIASQPWTPTGSHPWAEYGQQLQRIRDAVAMAHAKLSDLLKPMLPDEP